MARVMQTDKSAARRNEILDVAQRLVYTQGYDQMSIQDILDEMQISKGAFYHYFASKQDLLEALILRMGQEAEQTLLPIVEDPTLPPLEKLQRYFDQSVRWKTAHKDYLLALLRVWYADENALPRLKAQALLMRQAARWLSEIIRQGVADGVFCTPYPDQAGEMLLALILGLGDTFVDVLMADGPHTGDRERVERAVAAYTDALERILGAPTGSFELMSLEAIKEWVALPTREEVQA
jgi:TetR/AcrR family transcriptional regulator, transcriptional repressor for nem operon